MKILGISGSIRQDSTNSRILQIASDFLPTGAAFTIFEGLQDIPHFAPGADEEPPAFTKLKDALAQADGVIICTPEYAFGIPAVLKNALEWTVGVSSFNAKPVALITASTSGTKGHQALLWVLEAIGADMNADTQLLISFIRAKMDDAGNIKDEQTLTSIEQVVHSLTLLISESS